MSFHDMIFCSYDVLLGGAREELRQFRNYKRANMDNIALAILDVDWDCFSSMQDIDMKLEFYDSNIIRIHDNLVPLSSVIGNSIAKAWFIYYNEIKYLMYCRELAYRRWRSSRQPFELTEFKRFRNKVSTAI